MEAARVARKTRGQKGVLQVWVKRLTGVLLAGVTTHLQPYEAIILEPTTHQMAQETGLQNTTSWLLRDRGPYLGQYRVSTTCLATLSTYARTGGSPCQSDMAPDNNPARRRLHN